MQEFLNDVGQLWISNGGWLASLVLAIWAVASLYLNNRNERKRLALEHNLRFGTLAFELRYRAYHQCRQEMADAGLFGIDAAHMESLKGGDVEPGQFIAWLTEWSQSLRRYQIALNRILMVASDDTLPLAHALADRVSQLVAANKGLMEVISNNKMPSDELVAGWHEAASESGKAGLALHDRLREDLDIERIIGKLEEA